MKKNQRINKGNSLLAFPASFSVIDIETTGLSPYYDQIIELSAIKVIDGTVVDKFTTLVQPDPDCDGVYIDSFITELTGITNEMLASAPKLSSTLPDYLNFIGNDLLVGHNVNFDINFIYDKAESLLSETFSNDFVDTMRISRRLHPEFQHHRLADLCERYHIDYTNAHRSLSDCLLTLKCLSFLSEDVVQLYGSIDNFVQQATAKSVCASDIVATTDTINPNNLLRDKVIVFTGALDTLTRKEAMQIVVNHGGINADNVTQKTNYLVLGNNDYCTTIKDGKSRKQKRAEQLKLAGLDIEIIPESVFLDMLDEE